MTHALIGQASFSLRVLDTADVIASVLEYKDMDGVTKTKNTFVIL